MRYAVFLCVVWMIGCASPPPPSAPYHGLSDGDTALALIDVTVLDGAANIPTPNQTLLLHRGRIAAVGHTDSVELPPATRRIDGTDLYALPGFIDTHAHVTVLPPLPDGRLAAHIDTAASRQMLRTLLTHGITTVRNPAAPTEVGLWLRDQVAEGAVVGPRIVTTGAALNRTAPPFGPFVATPTEDGIRAEVHRQAALGVDAIKVYGALAPHLIATAIDEAHGLGLPVVGHLQRTTWTEAAELGIDHITHAAPWSAAYLPEAARSGYRGTFRDRITWLEQIDLKGEAIQTMIRAMVDAEVTLDPTLIAMHTKFWGNDARYRSHPSLALTPDTLLHLWRTASFTTDWSEADYARAQAAWPRLLALTKALHEAGVRLTVGSDTPNPWVIPGVSFHEEIQFLVDAGLSPADVLRAATHHGALALGLGDELGRIVPGYRADLVLLTHDPTAHIEHTQDIAWIIQAGTFSHPLGK
ncbi:MAG: amidohydrolase family protein [Rhodothermales bacterium]